MRAWWSVIVIPTTVLAGCSSVATTSRPPVLGCAPGMDVTDAAACWVWSDSVERAKPVANNTDLHPFMIGPDGKPIMTPPPISSP